jgi:hypothetical protein
LWQDDSLGYNTISFFLLKDKREQETDAFQDTRNKKYIKTTRACRKSEIKIEALKKRKQSILEQKSSKFQLEQEPTYLLQPSSSCETPQHPPSNPSSPSASGSPQKSYKGGKKAAHRSLQKSFPSQQSLQWLPSPETQELLYKAIELSVNFVHWLFLIYILILKFFFTF